MKQGSLLKNIPKIATYGFLWVTTMLCSRGAMAAYNQSILSNNYLNDTDCTTILQNYQDQIQAMTDAANVPANNATLWLSENSGAALPTGPLPWQNFSHYFWRIHQQDTHPAFVASLIGLNRTTEAVGPLPSASSIVGPGIISRALGYDGTIPWNADGASLTNQILIDSLGNGSQVSNGQNENDYLKAKFPEPIPLIS